MDKKTTKKKKEVKKKVDRGTKEDKLECLMNSLLGLKIDIDEGVKSIIAYNAKIESLTETVYLMMHREEGLSHSFIDEYASTKLDLVLSNLSDVMRILSNNEFTFVEET